MTVTDEMRQRWLHTFLAIRADQPANQAGIAICRSIREQLIDGGACEAVVQAELTAHRRRVKAHYRRVNAARYRRWTLDHKERNRDAIRAAQRNYARRVRALRGRGDRSLEHAKTAMKRAAKRGALIQSLEALLNLRAERSAARQAKQQQAHDRKLAAAARRAERTTETYKASLVERRRAYQRVYQMTWPRRSKRKLGRNAHRMPELVELYRLTCELKRMSK